MIECYGFQCPNPAEYIGTWMTKGAVESGHDLMWCTDCAKLTDKHSKNMRPIKELLTPDDFWKELGE